MPKAAPTRRDELTFRANLRQTRYGWLRLTPAHSVHLVRELLDRHGGSSVRVLDPFCGTGTTALVCAERGVACDTTDINPFLVWLAAAKSAAYTGADREAALRLAGVVASDVIDIGAAPPWTPPISHVERWWTPGTLAALGRAMGRLRAATEDVPRASLDLLTIAFLRTMIEHADVSFEHQSMSFRAATAITEPEAIRATWLRAIEAVTSASSSAIQETPRTLLCDARDLTTALSPGTYGCVVTSPPYPNRMSYIRELRPYMFWLGYLETARAAGELDWQAIGGTWGTATTMVARWQPESDERIPFDGFDDITGAIAARSDVLGRYVARYFHDMLAHLRSLFAVVAPGGTVHYIVGNSKFFDVLLPVERIFAALMEASGFEESRVETIRKRSSKKELFEYVVSARKRERTP